MIRPGPYGRPDPDAMARQLTQLIQQGKAAAILPRLKELASVYHDHAGVLHSVSEAALLAKRYAEAIGLAERAVALDSGNRQHQLQLAICLVGANDRERAVGLVGQLAKDADGSAEMLSILASLCVRVDEHQRAVALYRRAIELDPDNPRYRFSLAATYRFLGRLAAAETACDEAIEIDPKEFEAYLIRADLRKQSAEKNHIEQMQAVLADGADHYMGEVMLCHAIAKECEDVSRYDESFDYLRRGAALRRKHLSYDVSKDLRIMDGLVTTFTADRVRNATTKGCGSEEPIFIIGMPRTGTTLVERIIGSHSDVKSAGELPNFPQVMSQLVREQAAGSDISQQDMIAASLELDMRHLGEAYVDSTRGHTGDTARFIDKLPFNYLNVGLIRLALPNAKIIHVTREPMDTCYAVFKTLFQRAYPFSYDLNDLGRYFVAYQRLMDHWYTLFPDSMLTIAYENLVENTQFEIRRLIDYCGLAWQEQVTEFHQSEAPSTTASASQVRQPVYRSSVGKWRNYEQQLAPLTGLLESAGIGIQR